METVAEGVIDLVHVLYVVDEPMIRRFLTVCLPKQRLALKSVGQRIYIAEVRPRIKNQEDHPTNLANVVGAHTHDPSVARSTSPKPLPFLARCSP